jgi:hypothetical protein
MGGMMLKSKPGRIPWTVIDAWCRSRGYGTLESDTLERCLAIMDDEYLKWWAEREGGG